MATVAVSSEAGAMGFDDVLERTGTSDLGDGSSTVDIKFGYDPSVRFRVFVNGNNVANGTTVMPGDTVVVQYDVGDNNDNPGAFTDLDFLPVSGTTGERLFGESVGDLNNGVFRSRIESSRTGIAATGGSVFRLTNVDTSRWGDNNTCGDNSRTDRALNDIDNDSTLGDVAPVGPVGNTQMSFGTAAPTTPETDYTFTWANVSSSSCVAVDEYWDGFTARLTYTIQPCVTPAEATWQAGDLTLTEGETMNWPTDDATENQVFTLSMDCPPKPPVCTDYTGSAVAGGPVVTFTDLLMQHGTPGVLDAGQLHNAYDPDYNPDFYAGGITNDTPELRVTWISPTSVQGGTVTDTNLIDTTLVTGPAFPADPGDSTNATYTGNTVKYEPPASLSGEDYIYYQITDQSGIHAMCRIVIKTPPAPIAGSDYITVDAWYGALNTPTSSDTDVDMVDFPLFANDSDPLGGVLSVLTPPVTSAQGGTVTIDPVTGLATYAPAEGFCGEDSFSYTLQADDDDTMVDPVIPTRTTTGYVTIDVICNEAPVAIDDSANVVQGGTLSGTVAANDFDFEDPKADFVYTVVTAPTNGTLTLNADGSYTYTHDATTTPTTDTFTYQVCDQHATIQPPSDPAELPRCVEATATIYISAAPQAFPVAVADAAEVEAYYSGDGQAATSVLIDAAANDSDVDGNLDPTTLTVLSAPTAAQGTIVNNGDGTLTFTPTDGYSGPVTVV